MININSKYLLSLDFFHDNKNNIGFFKNNNIFNLNELKNVKKIEDISYNVCEYNINNFIFGESFENHVENLMINNFKQDHYRYEYYYNTIHNDNINIKYENEYTIICDNMQCTTKNILNVKMLLNNPRIKIYIPFILCCEEASKDKNNKILKSYNNLANNLRKSPLYNEDLFEILPCDFFDNSGNLLDNYIYESNLIGYDYINGVILNFNDLNDNISNITNLINKFIIFNNSVSDFKLKKTTNKISNYMSKYIKINQLSVNELNKNEIFNLMKSLIYSMKEMRDWYYIKEISTKFYYKSINNPIFITGDSISLFRSILYNISSINIFENHLKYMAIYQYYDNKKIVIYKQISPSYYYFNNDNNLNKKSNIYNNIINMDTYIVKKEVIKTKKKKLKTDISGGEYISKKQFFIKNINLDYNIIRYELFRVTQNLYRSLIDLRFFAKSFIDKIINNNIDNDIKIILKRFYFELDDFYNFCKLYNFDIIKNIDFSYKNITKFEIDNVIKLFDSYDVNSYKRHLDSLHRNYISEYDHIIDKLINNKFYLDHNKKLNKYELYISSLLSYIFDCGIEIEDREDIGYLFKIILNDYDYSLFRNVFANLYHNEKLYNDIKRGKKHLVRCFDYNIYDYKKDIVTYPYYDSDDDNINLEEYEDKYISHYDIIQKILNE